MKIKNVIARELLDSRGDPALEVDVILENGVIGRSMIPSGASKGTKEALELRDNDINRYNGKGLLKALYNVNVTIKNNIKGMNVENQKAIDDFLIKLDGTVNKSNLGANAILGVSLSCLKANVQNKNIPLYKCFTKTLKMPTALINIINGGKHSDNSLSFQEFMIVIRENNFHMMMQKAHLIFNNLKKILKNHNLCTGVGDEGGFVPNCSNEDAIKLINSAILMSSLKPGSDVYIALDIAANSFYNNGFYYLDGKRYNTDGLIDYYKYLISKYPIISIEDPLYEDDILGYQKLTNELKIQIVGDDLFTTNKKNLSLGIQKHIANAIIIKFNQIGTVSEAIETINLARKHNYAIIISHRSGEVEDNFIADLCVALSIGQIKCGSICRGERISKYNQLLRIENEIVSNT